jgi:hypothetical protein
MPQQLHPIDRLLGYFDGRLGQSGVVSGSACGRHRCWCQSQRGGKLLMTIVRNVAREELEKGQLSLGVGIG